MIRRYAAPVTWLCVLFAACSSPSTPPPPPPPPPPDTTPKDPAFCQFEAAPARAAGPAQKPAAVKAGLGSAVLNVPIGAPLGGYADRLVGLGNSKSPDTRPRRFSTSFVPSVGNHDALRAEALALEAGGERVVLVRIDAVLVNENALFALESKVAPDGSMRGRIVLSASHSHAGWAGWQPSLVLMPGIDRPRQELADRVIDAAAQAVKDAIAALAPAKLGVAIEPDFDPKDTISHDRRGENNSIVGPDGNTAGKGKDPVAWALRVDHPDGKPMAALVDIPVHGTVGDEFNPLASSDVPGGIERALTAELGYPVLHLQGAAGDVSPSNDEGRSHCPDPTRCLDMPRLEMIGARAAVLARPLIEGIQTSDTAALEVVTRTFQVARDAGVKRPDGTVLKYAPASPSYHPDGVLLDANGKIKNPVDEFNTVAGAGLCGDPSGGSFAGLGPIPGAGKIGPYSSCLDLTHGKDIIFGLFDVDSNIPVPLCDTVRATASAVRISGLPAGDFLMIAVPGEPTAPFAAYLRSSSPAGADHTLLVGYADDHIGYLLTAEDWLAGGYEPSINLWGPLEGEMILAGAIEAAKIAWTPEHEDPEAGTSRFVAWKYPPSPGLQPMTTTDHGTVAAAASIWWPDTTDMAPVILAASVSRAVGAARFTWNGGDPAVDLPEVIIEVESSPGVFTPVKGQKGEVATSRNGAVVLTYAPDPLTDPAPKHHVYAATWQPLPPDPFSLADTGRPFSLPLGKYRFHVTGTALSSSGMVPYDLISDPFQITAAPLSPSSSAQKAAGMLALSVLLPKAPGLRALRDGPSDEEIPLLAPWTVEVTFSDMSKKMLSATPDAKGQASIAMSAADLAALVSVDVHDAAGNGGTLLLP